MSSKVHSTKIKNNWWPKWFKPHSLKKFFCDLYAKQRASMTPKTLWWHQNEAQEKSAQCARETRVNYYVQKKSHKINTDSITITKLLLRTTFIQNLHQAHLTFSLWRGVHSFYRIMRVCRDRNAESHGSYQSFVLCHALPCMRLGSVMMNDQPPPPPSRNQIWRPHDVVENRSKICLFSSLSKWVWALHGSYMHGQDHAQ